MSHKCHATFMTWLAMTVFPLILAGQDALSVAEARHELASRPEIYFRFRLSPQQDLLHISQFVSVDNIRNDSVYAYANSFEFERFLTKGLPFTLLKHPGFNDFAAMADTNGYDQLLSWNYYPTYSAYEGLLAQFQANHPALCNIDTIGVLASGRKLLAARISDNVNTREAEPAVIYTSSLHGDETVGYILMLHLIDHLLSSYGADPLVTSLVNGLEIWINPLANPDGTYYAGNNTVNGAIRYNSNGIDLNRNFHDPLMGPNPYGYPTQPETQHFMNFAQSRLFHMGCNFHGGAELVNYPWDHKTTLHPDDAWWIRVSRQYADTVQAHAPLGYFTDENNGITNGAAWYIIYGGRQDYSTWFHYGRECTIELSHVKNPPASQLLNFWEYHYRSLLNYLKQALYGIHGTVTDSLTGVPLKAKVFISGHDADSSFVYSDLPYGNYCRYLAAGTWSVTFSAPGYQTRTISQLSVVNDAATLLNVKLMPLPGISGISGTLTYLNNAGTPLGGVTVNIKNSAGVTIATRVTDVSGCFVVSDIPTGAYHFECTTGKTPGGINAADALACLRHFVGLSYLGGLKVEAGDVNNTGYINSTDAQMIQKYFTGLLPAFVAGQWVFTVEPFNLQPGMNALSLNALCVGDADGSFVP